MVTLVCMPYVSIKRPSLALGLLKACLNQAGIPAMVEYGNLEFVQRVGLDRYSVGNVGSAIHLLGEWTFSGVVFHSFAPAHEAYLDSISYTSLLRFHHSPEERRRIVWELRGQADGFIDDMARRLVAARPRIVACTSTFQQNLASLALLKRVRELDPGIITMMGGANCEGSMGVAVLRNFPWVDYAVSGEADELFGPFCSELCERGRAAAVPYGVLAQGAPEPPLAPRASVRSMDAVPVPDFDDYFAQLRRYGMERMITPALPIETSRGCWWGAKHHCTFCGLNGHGMSFRSKTPERAVGEFHQLAQRYGTREFMVADNILAMSYFKTVLPQLVGSPYDIFYETKSNLKREQLELLAAAGVRFIQPGLESLSDELLSLMDKGTTALQNLQTLKWCRELGINVTWLMLFAFPGDDLEWYREMGRFIPLLTHLQPPRALIRVGFHRFSPYFERASEFGLDPVPEPTYQYVFGVSPEEQHQLAYFFVDRDAQKQKVAAILEVFEPPVLAWRDSFWDRHPVLCFEDDGETLQVFDTRPGAKSIRSRLSGLERRVLLECESVRSWASLVRSVGECEQAVRQLEAHGLLLRLGTNLLSLGVWGDPPALPHSTPQGKLAPYARPDLRAPALR